MYLRFGGIASLILASALSIAACSSKDDGNGGGGGGQQGDGGPGGGGQGDGGGPGGGGEDLTTSAGLAKHECDESQRCRELVFKQTYQDHDKCVAALTDILDAAKAAGLTQAAADPNACAAAKANCDVYLGIDPRVRFIAACEPTRGTHSSTASDKSCKSEFDCISGETCSDVCSANGECVALLDNEADICTDDSNCKDPAARCAYTFDGTTSDHRKAGEDNKYCKVVTLANEGDECADTTQVRCAPGLWCTSKLICQKFAGANQACDDPTTQQCDAVHGYSCQPVSDKGTAKTCQPTAYAEIGGGCGNVNGKAIVCAEAVAYCDMSQGDHGTCQARKHKGDPCTNAASGGGNNCLGGLKCKGTPATCQLPSAVACQ